MFQNYACTEQYITYVCREQNHCYVAIAILGYEESSVICKCGNEGVMGEFILTFPSFQRHRVPRQAKV